jgi:hypothetical protein
LTYNWQQDKDSAAMPEPISEFSVIGIKHSLAATDCSYGKLIKSFSPDALTEKLCLTFGAENVKKSASYRNLWHCAWSDLQPIARFGNILICAQYIKAACRLSSMPPAHLQA